MIEHMKISKASSLASLLEQQDKINANYLHGLLLLASPTLSGMVVSTRIRQAFAKPNVAMIRLFETIERLMASNDKIESEFFIKQEEQHRWKSKPGEEKVVDPKVEIFMNLSRGFVRDREVQEMRKNLLKFTNPNNFQAGWGFDVDDVVKMLMVFRWYGIRWIDMMRAVNKGVMPVKFSLSPDAAKTTELIRYIYGNYVEDEFAVEGGREGALTHDLHEELWNMSNEKDEAKSKENEKIFQAVTESMYIDFSDRYLRALAYGIKRLPKQLREFMEQPGVKELNDILEKLHNHDKPLDEYLERHDDTSIVRRYGTIMPRLNGIAEMVEFGLLNDLAAWELWN